MEDSAMSVRSSRKRKKQLGRSSSGTVSLRGDSHRMKLNSEWSLSLGQPSVYMELIIPTDCEALISTVLSSMNMRLKELASGPKLYGPCLLTVTVGQPSSELQKGEMHFMTSGNPPRTIRAGSRR